MNPYAAALFIFLLDYRAYTHASLTLIGILTATLTATAHAIHPWTVFFTLLGVFFLAGTAVTKVKADVKAGLTVSAASLVGRGRDDTGQKEKKAAGKQQRKEQEDDRGGVNKKRPPAHPRTATQVLCNSVPATICILLHAYLLYTTRIYNIACLPSPSSPPHTFRTISASNPSSLQNLLLGLLPYAVLAHYASATADTFSSELGILSRQDPVLITSLLVPPFRPQRVAKGTNGGITLYGTLAGLAGGALIGFVSASIVPFCGHDGHDEHEAWHWRRRVLLGLFVALLGATGSLLDSLLGALVQGSVVEKGGGGRVVENEGGGKVSVSKNEQGREYVMQGRDWLSNNSVNLLMCSVMSVSGMGIAWIAGIRFGD